MIVHYRYQTIECSRLADQFFPVLDAVSRQVCFARRYEGTLFVESGPCRAKVRSGIELIKHYSSLFIKGKNSAVTYIYIVHALDILLGFGFDDFGE